MKLDECDPTNVNLHNPGSSYYSSAPGLTWDPASDAHSDLPSKPYKIEVNGNTIGSYSGTSLSGSSYSSQLTCGANTIELTVVDNVGNRDADSETLYYDDCPPTQPGAPAITSYHINESGRPTLSWSSSSDSGSGLANYKIKIGNYPEVTLSSTTTSWQVTPALTSGSYACQLKAVDNLGLVSTITTFTLNIDTTDPLITSVTSSSHSSSIWSNSNSVSAAAVSTDADAGVDEIYFLLSSASSGVSPSSIISAGHDFTCSATSTCSASYTLFSPINVSGTYYIWAVSRDDARNVNGSPLGVGSNNTATPVRSNGLLIDLVAPWMTSPPSVQGLVNGYLGSGNVSINLGSASDQMPGSGMSEFRFYVREVNSNATPTYQYVSASQSTGTWPIALVHGLTYEACVQPIDGAGNIGNLSCSSQFITDLNPPTLVTFLQDMNGLNLTNSQNYWYTVQDIDFAWAASATSGISSVSYRFHTVPSGTWSGWTTFANSAGSGVDSLPTMAEGIYDVEFRATSGLGTTTIDTHRLNIDLYSPHSLTLSGPVGWSAATTQVLNWSASDSSSGVVNVTLFDSSTGQIANLCGQLHNSACTSSFSPLIIATGSFSLALDSGNYGFFFEACDFVGHCSNTSSSPTTVQVELGTPSCDLTVTPSGWTSGVPVVEFSHDAGGSVSNIATRLVWSFNGNELDNRTSPSSPYNLNGANDGVHLISFEVWNEAGTSAFCSGTAYVDASAPESVSNIVGMPSGPTNAALLFLSFTVEDQISGVDDVLMRIDGGIVITINGVQSAGVHSPESLSRDIDISSFNDGVHTLTWTVVDHAGNTRNTTRTFTIDRTAPEFAYFTSANEDHLSAVYGHDGVTLKWLVTDQDSNLTIELWRDGQLYASGLNPSEPGYELQLPTGTFEVVLKAIDSAQNQNSSAVLSLQFSFDGEVPIILCTVVDDTISESLPNQFTSVPNVVCQWTDVSAIATSSIVVTLDGGQVNPDAYGDLSQGISFADSLSTGSHSFTVSVADVHSNTATFSATLDVTGEQMQVSFSIGSPSVPGQQSVYLFTTGGDIGTRNFTSVNLDGIWVSIDSTVGQSNLEINLLLTPGQHNLTVIVSDQYSTVSVPLLFTVACPEDTSWDADSSSCMTASVLDPCADIPQIIPNTLPTEINSSGVFVLYFDAVITSDVARVMIEDIVLDLSVNNPTSLAVTTDGLSPGAGILEVFYFPTDTDVCPLSLSAVSIIEVPDPDPDPVPDPDNMSSADSVLPSWFGVTLISLLAVGVVIGLGVFILRRGGNDDTSEE